MLSGERHEKILRELEMRGGTLTVNGFAEKTGLSTMTIRRDLTQLAAQGLLRRSMAVPFPSPLNGKATPSTEEPASPSQPSASLSPPRLLLS